jgi:glycosyltransferase involved in cell wall biosynthesis
MSRKFDVVHLHATGPGALSPLVRLARMPVVVTVQGLDWRREKWGRGARAVLRLAAMVAAKAPHRTIVVSRELERHFREQHGAHTVYIPNGVNVDNEAGESPRPDLRPDGFVLFLGRLVPEKHVHTLIRAYRQVDGDMPLVIAGPDSHCPSYVDELEALAEDDPRVRLLGPQYGAAKAWLMHNALAFVQPSSIEGLPIALLEALSAARYPIVSSIPENLEPVTVGGKQMGLSVEVGDEAALAQAINVAKSSPDRRAVGDRLSAHVREVYDWREIASATEAVYYDTVAKIPRTRAVRKRTVRRTLVGTG